MYPIQDVPIHMLPSLLVKTMVISRGVLSVCAGYILANLPYEIRQWRSGAFSAPRKFPPMFIPLVIWSVGILLFMPRAFDQLLPKVHFNSIMENVLSLLGVWMMILYFFTVMGLRLYIAGCEKKDIVKKLGSFVVGLSLLAAVGVSCL